MENVRSNGAHPPPRRMALGSIKTGIISAPDRILLYGTEGVGKTTFGSQSESPIFLAAENGTGHVDVARFPEPECWQDILDAIGELISGKHDYRTLVIDTLDWLEPLAWRHVCANAKVSSIELVGGGWGKGFSAALEEWRRLLSEIERLRTARGMRLIFLAHAALRTVSNPEGPDFDRWSIKLHGGSKSAPGGAAGLVYEWCDHVLFARYQTFTVGGDQTRKGKGVSDGARVIHSQRTAAFDAKTRSSIPAILPLAWDDFAAALAAGKPGDPAVLLAQCEAMLPRVADEVTRAKVAETITRATGRASYLAKILDRLTALTGIAADATAAQGEP